MPLIPEALIDEIQSRVDIVDVIGRSVPLKRAGRHFKANCPFHKEKSPSFMVNTDKQIFHCFGCGIGGNVFSFLMQHDRLTFPEAVRQLADHLGIRLPEHAPTTAGASTQEPVTKLMEKVCQYFERRLLDARVGKLGRDYLKQRGVSEATRKLFRLGLAPAGWDHLLKAATATGITAEQLEAAGLAIRGKNGYYDRFRHRLIFPIIDVRGRMIGFGGRSLDGHEPKYLNSPETVLYSKGRHLFGLYQAKEAIMKTKTAIVVEGYFDCVVLVDGELTHVVSPLGTALTLEQARLLKRYAQQVILAFDADVAGEQATLRGIDTLVEVGLQVRVAQFPQGIDPDEYLRSHGRAGLEHLFEQSLGLFEFLVQMAMRRYPTMTVEGKVHAAQFVLPTIANVPDAMLRSEYVKLLAERLRLDEAAVTKELSKVSSRSMNHEPSRVPAQSVIRSKAVGSERLLTALVLDEPSRWQGVQQQISIDDMTDPTLRRLLGIIGELQQAGQTTTPAQVISRVSEEGHGSLVTELVELARVTTPKEPALQECLHRIHHAAQQRELANLREQLRIAQETGQETNIQELLTAYQHHLSAAQSQGQPGVAQLQGG